MTTPQIREVTAAQLTGQVSSTTTGNGSNSGRATPGDGNDTTTPTPARRPRRNRRTPSQISTKSLPAYNAEPGDEEVVIYRCVPSWVLVLRNVSLTAETAARKRRSNIPAQEGV